MSIIYNILFQTLPPTAMIFLFGQWNIYSKEADGADTVLRVQVFCVDYGNCVEWLCNCVDYIDWLQRLLTVLSVLNNCWLWWLTMLTMLAVLEWLLNDCCLCCVDCANFVDCWLLVMLNDCWLWQLGWLCWLLTVLADWLCWLFIVLIIWNGCYVADGWLCYVDWLWWLYCLLRMLFLQSVLFSFPCESTVLFTFRKVWTRIMLCPFVSFFFWSYV